MTTDKVKHDNIPKREKDYLKKILKCPECFSIPEISYDNDGYYKYKCRNNHKERLQLNELLDKCLISDILYKCVFCNKTNNKDNFLFFYYCFNCKKVICSKEKCLKIHKKKCSEDFNNFIPCNNLTSLCYEYGEKLNLYCINCDLNICEKCKGHEKHEIKFMNQMTIDLKKKILNYIIIKLNLLKII